MLRVIDGDTLLLRISLGFDVMKDIRLRLLGVDSPEMRTPKGIEARDWVVKWVEANETPLRDFPFTVRSHKARNQDKYGRYLAELMSPTGSVLNQELLIAGIAEPASF